jgi:hypothetical protein
LVCENNVFIYVNPSYGAIDDHADFAAAPNKERFIGSICNFIFGDEMMKPKQHASTKYYQSREIYFLLL